MKQRILVAVVGVPAPAGRAVRRAGLGYGWPCSCGLCVIASHELLAAVLPAGKDTALVGPCGHAGGVRGGQRVFQS